MDRMSLANKKREPLAPVQKRPESHLIPATEQALAAAIPDCESELPEKITATGVTPFFVSRKQQPIIAARPFPRIKSERTGQVSTVVKSHIRADRQVRETVGRRRVTSWFGIARRRIQGAKPAHFA